MKNVLTVQDLSCLGKCSLTVALPVLSAMGCAATALPTAVLSTHTAFPKPHVRSLTEDISNVCDHWKTVGVSFDAVSIGYLSDPQQAKQVEYLLDSFPAFTVVDPVMGDHGKLYRGIGEDHVAAVKQLCKRADVILPNITEACLLTGISYRESGDEAYYQSLLEGLKPLASHAVLTGVSLADGKTGIMTDSGYVYQRAALPGRFHGTGDIFAAVFTGAAALGKTVEESAKLAALFVEQVILSTPAPTPFGVSFEKALSWLWQQLNG